jgi:predicted xylose isomerase-like sugar epimerase
MKKLIWPILGLIVMAVLTTIQQVNADNVITASEWVMVALQALMAFNVWATANLPQYASMKSYVAAAIAMVSLLVSLITGGLTTNEIVNLIITGLAALGVIFTPQPITTVINGTTVPANGEVRGTNRQLG